jgi:hypothetical protein
MKIIKQYIHVSHKELRTCLVRSQRDYCYGEDTKKLLS